MRKVAALAAVVTMSLGTLTACSGSGDYCTELKNYAAAAELYKKRYESAPHPENLYDWGDALVKAGKRAEARSVFARFEAAALAESEKLDNANRELALYYLDHAQKPVQGLRIAKFEAGRRRDVHTLEIYAKALRMNGKEKESQQALAEAGQRLNATLIAVRR